MKVCKQCGQSVQDVETYCPRCGSRQLVTATQRPQQNRVPQNNMNGNITPPSTSRQPQPAPPGYRNPNYVPPQNNPNHVPNRAPQQNNMPNRPINNGMPNGGMPNGGMPNGGMPRQNNRPPMQNPNMAPQNGFNPQMQNNMQGNGFGFQDTGMSNGFENQPKKKFGFGKSKQPKAPKQPKQPKAPKQPKQQNMQNMQNMGGGVPPHMQNMQNGYEQSQIDNSIVSIKDWLIIIIKMMIPIYNIIFIIGAWTGKPMNESVRNYLKLYTFVIIAMLVLTLLMSATIGAMFSSMFW